MNQNVTEAQITEAQDWAADCMGLEAGHKPGAERAVAYVEAEYPGGWAAFVAECCETEEPAAEQSGQAAEGEEAADVAGALDMAASLVGWPRLDGYGVSYRRLGWTSMTRTALDRV